MLRLVHIGQEVREMEAEVKGKIGALETKVDGLEQRVGALEGRVEAIENRVDELDKRISRLEKAWEDYFFTAQQNIERLQQRVWGFVPHSYEERELIQIEQWWF